MRLSVTKLLAPHEKYVLTDADMLARSDCFPVRRAIPRCQHNICKSGKKALVRCTISRRMESREEPRGTIAAEFAVWQIVSPACRQWHHGPLCQRSLMQTAMLRLLYRNRTSSYWIMITSLTMFCGWYPLREARTSAIVLRSFSTQSSKLVDDRVATTLSGK